MLFSVLCPEKYARVSEVTMNTMATPVVILVNSVAGPDAPNKQNADGNM